MERQTINFMFTPAVDALIPFVDSNDFPPVYYAGIQTWVTCFLTTIGSRVVDPDYGTSFIPKLRGGYLFTENDVYKAFALANSASILYCRPASGQTGAYVVSARISHLDVDETDIGRHLIIYVSFTFSDGVTTRTNLEVA